MKGKRTRDREDMKEIQKTVTEPLFCSVEEKKGANEPAAHLGHSNMATDSSKGLISVLLGSWQMLF